MRLFGMMSCYCCCTRLRLTHTLLSLSLSLRIWRYAQSIADGIAALHNLGIIHRDIKAEHIFTTPTEAGNVTNWLLSNFTVARRVCCRYAPTLVHCVVSCNTTRERDVLIGLELLVGCAMATSIGLYKLISIPGSWSGWWTSTYHVYSGWWWYIDWHWLLRSVFVTHLCVCVCVCVNVCVLYD
jgi:hypothetical protein